MTAGRRERARNALRAAGADALLLCDPGAVAWLTGHETPIATGPSPFAVGAMAMLGADGSVLLFAADDEDVPSDGDAVEAVRFPGFGLGPLDRLTAARRALTPHLAGRRVGVEAATVPVGLLDAAASWVDVTAPVLAARAVKDPDELDRLRAALALCDAGQAALRGALGPGRTELELWAAARDAMDARAGTPLVVLADLVSGPRTAGVGGPPTERTVCEGELVLCDLAPRHDGYWGDSCATVAVGEPSAWAVAAHRRASDALDAAVAAVRPGLTAGALDALVRAGLAELPHHVGHGIGGSAHEEPRVIPQATMVLEAGMVIALEPGVYGDGEGVRVEVVVLVEEDGAAVLSNHDLTL
ncbi:MAG: peptidase [Conexibacter sp.]|nr:peptidase [Conexibacter sp.]